MGAAVEVLTNLEKVIYICPTTMKISRVYLRLGLIIVWLSSTANARGQRDLDRMGMMPRQEAGKLLDKGYCDDSYAIYSRLYSQDSLMMDFLGMVQSETCRRRYEEADRMLRWAIKRDSMYVPAYYTMGKNFIAQAEEDSALFYFKTYNAVTERKIRATGTAESEDPRAWLYIGNIYRFRMHKRGITDKEWIAMMSAYERYLEIKPNDPAQYQLRMFLESATEKRPDPDGVLIWDERP